MNQSEQKQSDEREEAPFSLAACWEWAGRLLGYIASLFGAPVALMERGFIARIVRRQIGEWLSPIEAFVRRLLLLEAAALDRRPPAGGKNPSRRAAMNESVRRPGAGGPPIRFHIFPPRRDKKIVYDTGESPPDASAGEAPIPSAPIARRFSALVRVVENPAPYARRLARLLHAQTEDDPIVVGPKPSFPINPVGPMFDEAHERATAAALRFHNTS